MHIVMSYLEESKFGTQLLCASTPIYDIFDLIEVFSASRCDVYIHTLLPFVN